MSRTVFTRAWASVLLLTAAVPAAAQTMAVDQSNPPNNAGYGVGLNAQPGPIGQSFTPTLAALNYASFYVYNTSQTVGIVTASLYARGTGSGTLLGTSNAVTLGVRAAPGASVFSFDTPISLVPSSLYSLVLNSSLPDGQIGVQVTDDTYAGGTLIYFGGTNAAYGDLAFSEGLNLLPAAVPELASWAMMILGMGAVGFALRSAKRRSDAKFDARIKRIAAGLEE